MSLTLNTTVLLGWMALLAVVAIVIWILGVLVRFAVHLQVCSADPVVPDVPNSYVSCLAKEGSFGVDV